MEEFDFVLVRGPRSLGQLVHTINHAAGASDTQAIVDLGGNVFADIQFHAEDDWPYMLTVWSRTSVEVASQEHVLRICRLMETKGWEYEHTSGADVCAFCMGRQAAHDGKSKDRNPYPESTAFGGNSRYDSDFGMWTTGYEIGLWESGLLPDSDSVSD
jgi:hypothetical protein